MASFPGLELLATAVVALDERFVVRYANPAAENLLATGAKSLNGQPFLQLFVERDALARALGDALNTHWDYSAQNVTYSRAGREPLPLACTMTRIEASFSDMRLALLAELRRAAQAAQRILDLVGQVADQLAVGLLLEHQALFARVAQLLLDRPQFCEQRQVQLSECTLDAGHGAG